MTALPPHNLCLPYEADLPTIRIGDIEHFTFLAPGVCWTEDEPEGELPDGIEWSKHVWGCEVAVPFRSPFNYRQQWVPLYGRMPSTWVWWKENSKAGMYSCSSKWDPDLGGTVVTGVMYSEWSARLLPGSYVYDLRSAVPLEDVPPEEAVYRVTDVTTWMTGKVKVRQSVTSGYINISGA